MKSIKDKLSPLAPQPDVLTAEQVILHVMHMRGLNPPLVHARPHAGGYLAECMWCGQRYRNSEPAKWIQQHRDHCGRALIDSITREEARELLALESEMFLTERDRW